jgi:hypothetical protein
MQRVVSVLGHYKVLAYRDGIAPHCYQLKEILPKKKNRKNNKKAYHYVLKDKLFYFSVNISIEILLLLS